MNASSKGFLDIVRFLVEDAGASIDAQSKHGYSALSEFSTRHLVCCDDSNPRSPTVNAASKGNLPIVLFLTKRGGSPLLRNSFGETAFDLGAAVFEVHVCSVLAALESSLRTPYNPLTLHSTIPVVLHENQRLARPSLKKISSLSTLAQSPRWSSKALSRNDNRTAFSFHSLLGTAKEDTGGRPVFRSEVGLPIVGKEGELVLPEAREVRSAGRTGSGRAVPTVAEGKRPAAGNRRTSASSALAAVLESSSTSSPLASPPTLSNSSFVIAGEPAWFWLSDWVRRSSPCLLNRLALMHLLPRSSTLRTSLPRRSTGTRTPPLSTLPPKDGPRNPLRSCDFSSTAAADSVSEGKSGFDDGAGFVSCVVGSTCLLGGTARRRGAASRRQATNPRPTTSSKPSSTPARTPPRR